MSTMRQQRAYIKRCVLHRFKARSVGNDVVPCVVPRSASQSPATSRGIHPHAQPNQRGQLSAIAANVLRSIIVDKLCTAARGPGAEFDQKSRRQRQHLATSCVCVCQSVCGGRCADCISASAPESRTIPFMNAAHLTEHVERAGSLNH